MTLLKLRSAPTLSLNDHLQIDRANYLIRDAVAMQANVEALGHGVQSDMKTLTMTKDLADQHKYGIRQRFGHPGMSENAAGKKIAVAKNFTIKGDKLVHDMHLLDSAELSPVFARDPIEYIFHMADKHPNELGESVVIEAEAVWTFGDGSEWPADGPPKPDVETDIDGRPVNALTPLPVIRPTAFYYVDVVSEGALTHDGLFEADMVAQMFSGTSSVFADEAFDLVDRWRDEYNVPLEDVPNKFNAMMQKYVASRARKEHSNMPTGMKGNRTVSKKKFEDASANGGPVPETTAPETQTDAEQSADPLDAALDQAEDTSAALEEPEDDDDPEETEAEDDGDTVSLAALHKTIQTMAVQIDKLTKLTLLNTDNVETLNRNLQRVAGEPVVTDRVPKHRPAKLEPISRGGGSRQSFDAAPVPPARLAEQKPQHVSERKSGTETPLDFDEDPDIATFLSHARNSRRG